MDLQAGESRFWGYACVISGMLSQAVLGIVPVWGNISIYITSYLRLYDPSVTLRTTYVIFPITLLFAASFMQLGSYLNQKINPRIQVALGSLLIFGSIFSCSFIINAYLFIATYSVVIGMSFGIMYMPGLKNAWLYFPSRKGLVSGVVLASYSAGAILWTILTKAVANPDNAEPVGDYFLPDQGVAQNVPKMLRLLSYIQAGMSVVAVALIQRRVV